MVKIRSLDLTQDCVGLSELDTSFTTDLIYRVEQNGFAFRLTEETVCPPVEKRYLIDAENAEEKALWDHAIVAEIDGAIVGFVAAHFSEWNRRAEVRHLYVAPDRRQQGVGKLLMNSVKTFAREKGARCVWVETQNVNLPAAKFYLSQGFSLCGLDRSLYDQENDVIPEIALYFTRTG